MTIETERIITEFLELIKPKLYFPHESADEGDIVPLRMVLPFIPKLYTDIRISKELLKDKECAKFIAKVLKDGVDNFFQSEAEDRKVSD